MINTREEFPKKVVFDLKATILVLKVTKNIFNTVYLFLFYNTKDCCNK